LQVFERIQNTNGNLADTWRDHVVAVSEVLYYVNTSKEQLVSDVMLLPIMFSKQYIEKEIC